MTITFSAELSPCRSYRYTLWRVWDKTKPYALFVGLNPSTADENNDDPTILRCIEYSKRWGYGGLCMANLFAFRTTYPRELRKTPEPVGIKNDLWLERLSRNAGIIIAAWGNNGTYLNRFEEVMKILKNVSCLQLNKSGQPSHPLYLRKDLKPKPYLYTPVNS